MVMLSSYKTLADFRREIPILELALSIGYELLPREGLKWPVLKNRDMDEKIIIVNPGNPSNQGYFNPHDDSDRGILTHFIRNRLGTCFDRDPFKTEYENVYRIMYRYLNGCIGSLAPETGRKWERVIAAGKTLPFHVPEYLLLPLTDKSFLLGRGISESTIIDSLFRGRLFNTNLYGHVNTVFPYCSQSGGTTALEIRNEGFKHFYPGSTLDCSVWHSELMGNKQRIVLTESPVDALSYHQLKGAESNIYVAFGGSVSNGQLEMVSWIREGMRDVQASSIISAVDNDAAGEAYNRKFDAAFGRGLVIDKPQLKDYNEDLKRHARQSHFSHYTRHL